MASLEQTAGKTLEQRIASLLGPSDGYRRVDWHCVFKARYGMRVAFDAIRSRMGEGVVVTQLLTCCTAVDPILAAGLTPLYADIWINTALVDPDRLALPDDCRAVMLQHTYGIIDDAASRRLVERAHAAGAVVIEDCAHCVGRMAVDEEGHPLADISIGSFRYRKGARYAVWRRGVGQPPFPVHRGGGRTLRTSCRAARAARPHRLRRARQPLSAPCLRASAASAGARSAPRASRPGSVEPAVSDDERRGQLPYDPMRPSRFVCEKAWWRSRASAASRTRAPPSHPFIEASWAAFPASRSRRPLSPEIPSPC